ncbi:hypothetical protein HYT26_04615 [Candidatus Pacearchaeota archaeon]|nr:hypothetical protein [Candidatus Pacearchaeota archaeon]
MAGDTNKFAEITEMIGLVEGLDSCNRHMEEAYRKSENPDLSDEERADFRGYAWEHLDESLYIFSRIREMPATTLLTCIDILEHDQDAIGFPKNSEEQDLYERIEAMKCHVRKIIEETG